MTCPSASKEKRREYREQWKKNNPDWFVNYRATHREFLAQRMREWYAKNKKHRIEYVKKWVHEHPEVHAATLEYMKLKHFGKIAVAEFCETCPEDDIRKATGNHHPDYDYPQIVVSCCDSCHHYLNANEKLGLTLNGKKK
jgi:hypothetical protein